MIKLKKRIIRKLNARSYKKLKRKKIYRKVENSLKRRNRSEKLFRFYGIAAIFICIVFLFILLSNIIANGYKAFFQTNIQLTLNLDPQMVKDESYTWLINDAFKQAIPTIKNPAEIRYILRLFSSSAVSIVQKTVEDNKQLIGTKITLWLPASSDVDMLVKKGGLVSSKSGSRIGAKQIEWLKTLDSQDKISLKFNKDFFVNGDSREAELAGIFGSLIGSLFVIISCILLAFPIGVAAAIYLEEFAPKSILSEIIEVNTNNLAAVPSIVFGLLGLTLYVQFIGIPRSSSLAGGLTLALIALPIIVISTRMSIRAIPSSIREGAMALGASKWQVTIHHVLPLAMPGIMTGSILSIARVLGETAPLLMVGMVAFIVDVPKNFLSAATVMPVQIYLWSDSVEQGFVEKASAAIIVLLLFLGIINIFAAYVRKKFEVRW